MVPFQGYHNNFAVSEGNLQLGNTDAPSQSSFGYKSFRDTLIFSTASIDRCLRRMLRDFYGLFL